MRIGLVHSYYSSAQPSGENSVVDDQARLLTDAGHDLRLIARRTDDVAGRRLYAAQAAWTTLTGIGPSPGVGLSAFAPDVIHVHNTFPNWGTRWTRAWSDRLVCTVHNFRPVCAAGTLVREHRPCEDCLSRPVLPAVRHGCYRGSAVASVPVAIAAAPRGSLRTLLQGAAAVVALNSDAQQLYERVLEREVALVPNFVPQVAERGRAQRNNHWVFVGRLAAEKGVLRMLESWPRDKFLDLYGSGPEAEAVAGATAEMPNVRFHGQVAREALLERLGEYDGLVVPSLWAEGLPTVILEAQARGVPSIVSRHVAAAPALEAAGAAVIYDPSDVDSLDRALELVRGDRDGYGERSAALHHAEYSPEVWLRRMEAVYATVQEGGGQHGRDAFGGGG